jgi:coenzyme F420-reducing hydrogenase alpha subunit
MARICGICPVSHLIASAKACDQLLAVRIPPTADKLRRIFGLAQVLQSHALSFFHLSSPDLVLGMDSDPARSAHLSASPKKIPKSRAMAFAFASSASRLSSGSAASAFIPPGSFPAA